MATVNKVLAAFDGGGKCFLAAAVAMFVGGPAHCQSLVIDPYVGVTETYSTNALFNAGPAVKGWITTLSPAIRLTEDGARVKGSLFFRRDEIHYSGRNDLVRNLNYLNSAATVEAIDKWLYIDANANITQNAETAFNPIAPDATGVPANQSETSTFQISPYIRGVLSDVAAYQLRFNAIDSRSSDGPLARTRVNQWIGALTNASAGAKIGWSADGSVSKVRNSVIGELHDTRLRSGLIFEVLPKLHLSVTDGREQTNYATPNERSLSTPGMGVDWRPSSRTEVVGMSERRFFGTGHSVLLSHRLARVAWRYSDIKDVDVLPSVLATSTQGAVYQLMSDLMTASIPNPAARAEAVRRLLGESGRMIAQGDGGVQTSRLYIDRTREASMALLGNRNTITLTLVRTDEEALSGTAATVDVYDTFSLSNAIRQTGGGVSWDHDLTRLAKLDAGLQRLRSEGVSNTSLRSTETSATVMLSFQLDLKTSLATGLRRTKFDSTLNGSFDENAVIGSLVHHF